MLFPTLSFAAFFAVVLPVSWLLMPQKIRWRLFMVGASWFFYGAADWRFVPLLAGSTVANHYFARRIHRATGAARRTWTITAVTVNLGVLAWFKYVGFLSLTLQSTLHDLGIHAHVPLPEVLLPVGISFFTFQALSYVIDTSRGKIRPVSLLEFAVYLSFFPHLIAGPIVRATEFLPQIKEKISPRSVDVGKAFWLISLGLFKKVVISSYLSTYAADPLFGYPRQHAGIEALFGVYAYAIQIYMDFSGYTDIAIGLALLLGIQFPQNFNAPYAAASLQDFWRRWHMTLSRWLRDYLYIPLGGNRQGRARTYVNIMITMLLGGLWHGAAWTFVAWGALHGIGLCIERWRTEAKEGGKRAALAATGAAPPDQPPDPAAPTARRPKLITLARGEVIATARIGPVDPPELPPEPPLRRPLRSARWFVDTAKPPVRPASPDESGYDPRFPASSARNRLAPPVPPPATARGWESRTAPPVGAGTPVVGRARAPASGDVGPSGGPATPGGAPTPGRFGRRGRSGTPGGADTPGGVPTPDGVGASGGVLSRDGLGRRGRFGPRGAVSASGDVGASGGPGMPGGADTPGGVPSRGGLGRRGRFGSRGAVSASGDVGASGGPGTPGMANTSGGNPASEWAPVSAGVPPSGDAAASDAPSSRSVDASEVFGGPSGAIPETDLVATGIAARRVLARRGSPEDGVPVPADRASSAPSVAGPSGATSGGGDRAGWAVALGLPALSPRARLWLGRLITFHFVCLAWVFFRATSFQNAIEVLRRIATLGGTHRPFNWKVAAVVVGSLAIQVGPRGMGAKVQVFFSRRSFWAQALMLAGVLTMIDLLGPAGVAPFIYFRF